ncbi:hypothetical protein ZIOFF_061029 [Zingiber officinale]|uniref:Uridine kinase n=1 Tax=Zingiber officinale TaxID=94328 RepID=A0A8J5KLH6_ZINOF|nr:hypothetical protein ZIOFF_061029 [Zingiber officinale]
MHLEVLFVWVANFHHWTLLVTQLAPVCFHPSFLIGEHVAALTYLHEYSKFVKPAFDDFILPTKKYTDIIIPRGGDNHVAIDLIVQHIHTKLGQHNLCKIYPNLSVIQSTFQIRGMHTLIRDAKTTTHDFIFYSDRLIRLVVEHGLGHLPFKEKQIITPTGAAFFHCPVARDESTIAMVLARRVRHGACMMSPLRCSCDESAMVLVRQVCRGARAMSPSQWSCDEFAPMVARRVLPGARVTSLPRCSRDESTKVLAR